MSSKCSVWDFNVACEYIDYEDILAWLKKHCDKWVFQKEMGEIESVLHWQGRVHFKVKKLKSTILNLCPEKNYWDWSVTSGPNKQNFDYAEKEETRVDGPWNSEDIVDIPTQYKNCELKPWQNEIWWSLNEKPENRIINVIFDPEGNKGKSWFIGYCCIKKKAVFIPPMKDFRDIMRAAQCAPQYGTYFIDCGRAMKQTRELYEGIEYIKSGFLFDDRYKYQFTVISYPHIWVYMNEIPNLDYLSKDRWKIWKINKEEFLKRIYIE